MTIHPTISVVIPCYNAARYLDETLRTVMGQSHQPLEVLVVDDGSTDDSGVIAAGFGPLVRVIRQENQGESVARNRGMDEARGDWIALLDADDLWAPTKLQRQLDALEPDTTCVHTSFYYFGTAEGQVDLAKVPEDLRYRVDHVAVTNPFRISSMLVRRSLPVRFPVGIQYGEDLIYFLDLALAARIRLVPEFLTGYRVHASGQSANPMTNVYRHQNVEAWLLRNQARLDEGTIASVRSGWLRLMTDLAIQARYQREWQHYWSLRRYLERFADRPEPGQLLRERVYPRWAYALKDRVDRWRGQLAGSRSRASAGST